MTRAAFQIRFSQFQAQPINFTVSMITQRTKTLMRQLCVVLFASCSFTQLVLAQRVAPLLIPFQGRLTDQAGTVIPDGLQTLSFKLYDQAVEGDAAWTERHENVEVINGMANVFLGSINEFPKRNADQDSTPENYTLFFSETKYLGITVDDPTTTNDIEMLPRQIIVSAFHARSVDTLNGYDWSSLLVNGNSPAHGSISGSKIQEGGITSSKIFDPSIEATHFKAGSVRGGEGGTIQDGSITAADLSDSVRQATPAIGAILPYAGSVEPVGWMFCDGRLLNPAAYVELHAAIGFTWGTDVNGDFKLPDMRGRVLAGKTDVDTVDRLTPTLDDGSSLLFNDLGAPADSSTLGAVGGEDMHQTTEVEMPSHTHSGITINHTGFEASHSGIIDGGPHLSGSAGGDRSHNNVQPTLIVNYIIRVGSETILP
jgi:microcystin-dependent protein